MIVLRLSILAYISHYNGRSSILISSSTFFLGIVSFLTLFSKSSSDSIQLSSTCHHSFFHHANSVFSTIISDLYHLVPSGFSHELFDIFHSKSILSHFLNRFAIKLAVCQKATRLCHVVMVSISSPFL
jgi:hypothetical protein